jgi:hypothetical protein
MGGVVTCPQPDSHDCLQCDQTGAVHPVTGNAHRPFNAHWTECPCCGGLGVHP